MDYMYLIVNRLLPWLSQVYSNLNLIYIYRHPCAVISSQLRHEAFCEIDKVSLV